MNNLLIRNGRVIDPANNIDEVRDLFVTEGKIAESPAPNAEIIDAAGLVIAPGLMRGGGGVGVLLERGGGVCSPGCVGGGVAALEQG